jgi:hypothetical protein
MASRWLPSLVALEIKAARGRVRTPDEIRQLIREMSVANPLWGAFRIHGELLKLGMDVGQTTVAKYMAKRRRPPSQGWSERHLRHVLASYQNTTTRSERTYRCRRTRRFGVMCAAQDACVRRRSWAGYTINTFEFEFPTGTIAPKMYRNVSDTAMLAADN